MFPPSDNVFPFEFLLPPDLPSSFVENRATIAYSIYANIDVAFKLDPSCRAFFTVVQPVVAAAMMNPGSCSLTSRIYQQFCFPPCCCPADCTLVDAVGNLSIRITTDRSAYAPGEVIQLSVKVESADAGPVACVTNAFAALIQYPERHASNHSDRWDVEQARSPTVRLVIKETALTTILVPSLPPSYRGGLGHNEAWFGEVAR